MTHSAPNRETIDQKTSASAETARWAFASGEEALGAVALGGELGQFLRFGGASLVDIQADELLAAFVDAAKQGGVPATSIERARVNAEDKVPDDLFWASFVADRQTGFILAAVGLNYEECALHEQRRVGFSPVAFYFSMAGEPFQSLFRVVNNGRAYAAVTELHFQASHQHGGSGNFSLSFALAAWEADELRRSLREGEGKSDGADTPAAPGEKRKPAGRL